MSDPKRGAKAITIKVCANKYKVRMQGRPNRKMREWLAKLEKGFNKTFKKNMSDLQKLYIDLAVYGSAEMQIQHETYGKSPTDIEMP